jgi:hypothetical protein
MECSGHLRISYSWIRTRYQPNVNYLFKLLIIVLNDRVCDLYLAYISHLAVRFTDGLYVR